jgi:hypothetical protein
MSLEYANAAIRAKHVPADTVRGSTAHAITRHGTAHICMENETRWTQAAVGDDAATPNSESRRPMA